MFFEKVFAKKTTKEYAPVDNERAIDYIENNMTDYSDNVDFNTLTEEQKEVLYLLANGENIFLTGNAGTGKTYLIKAFEQYCLNNNIRLMKTAPTGIASVAIEGATLHHQFKLNTGVDFSIPKTPPKCLAGVDVLLVDEISMVRIDVFEIIIQKVFLENERRKKFKRNPIQLVFVGDFYQLAPVVTKEEKPFFIEHYGENFTDGFCFKSPYWDKAEIKTCVLTKVIRQDNIDFCSALDKCKMGDTSCLWYIKNNVSKEPMPNGIWVCGRNSTVAKKNDEELAKLKGTLLYSEAIYEGEADKNDRLCDEIFAFKIGARVVMLVNDTENYLYQNGSLGTIIDYFADTIVVELDNGKLAKVKRNKFPKMEYVYEEGEDENSGKLEKKAVGNVRQFPMRLGFAITVHKSQGQTYEQMNLMPEIFSFGQLYVALSRCKTIENIYVEGYLSQRMVMTSPDVLAFYSEQNNSLNPSDNVVSIEVPVSIEKEVRDYISYLKSHRL